MKYTRLLALAALFSAGLYSQITPYPVPGGGGSSGSGISYCAPTSASTTTYTCTPSPALTAYAAGTTLGFIPDVTATAGAVTVNVNSLGAKRVYTSGTTDPTASSLLSANNYTLVYNGTAFILTGGAANGANGPLVLDSNAAAVISTNGAASVSPLKLDGTWFSSTNCVASVLIKPSAATGITCNSGSGLDINAPTGWGGFLQRWAINGTVKAYVFNDGSFTGSGYEVSGKIFSDQGGYNLVNTAVVKWSSTSNNPKASFDSGFGRNAAGIMEVNSGTLGTYRDIASRHALSAGTAPTLTSGTGGAPVGGDEGGSVTLSAGAQASVTLTFNTAFSAAPSCTANDQTSAGIHVQAIPTASVLVLNAIAMTTGTASTFGAADKLNWVCKGFL